MEFSEVLFVAGRVLFGGFFLMMGMMHFTKTEMLTNMAKSKNVPAAKAAVLLGGLLLLVGGAGIVFNSFIIWAALSLIVFLLPTAFKMHNFWAMQDPQEKMMQMNNFMRNMAFLGAVLIFLFFSL